MCRSTATATALTTVASSRSGSSTTRPLVRAGERILQLYAAELSLTRTQLHALLTNASDDQRIRCVAPLVASSATPAERPAAADNDQLIHALSQWRNHEEQGESSVLGGRYLLSDEAGQHKVNNATRKRSRSPEPIRRNKALTSAFPSGQERSEAPLNPKVEGSNPSRPTSKTPANGHIVSREIGVNGRGSNIRLLTRASRPEKTRVGANESEWSQHTLNPTVAAVDGRWSS